MKISDIKLILMSCNMYINMCGFYFRFCQNHCKSYYGLFIIFIVKINYVFLLTISENEICFSIRIYTLSELYVCNFQNFLDQRLKICFRREFISCWKLWTGRISKFIHLQKHLSVCAIYVKDIKKNKKVNCICTLESLQRRG